MTIPRASRSEILGVELLRRAYKHIGRAATTVTDDMRHTSQELTPVIIGYTLRERQNVPLYWQEFQKKLENLGADLEG